MAEFGRHQDLPGAGAEGWRGHDRMGGRPGSGTGQDLEPVTARSPAAGPVARFDDVLAATSLQFDTVREVILARTPEQVLPALRAVQAAVDAGSWAVGMVTYEAAAGIDPHAQVHEDPLGPPLVWFGLADGPADECGQLPGTSPADDDATAANAGMPGPGRGEYRVGPWIPEWTQEEHAAAVERIHGAIAEGETYQVNLTTRLRSRIEGDLLACHRDLIARQQAAHTAYLDTGDWTFLSASPELFVQRRGDHVLSRPMKGTAARGDGPARDAVARAELLASEKERAENIMIVDLIRNDLARIARTGSVEVPQLLQAEQYPTLWQMTSTVTAQAAEGTGLPELFGALFPCGSITGAPKLSTMRLIRQLEPTPRGIYCGAIGLLSPSLRRADGTLEAARSQFNVAIRTLQVDRRDGSATYGVGGGITWASRAEAEWEELLTKAEVLTALTAERRPHAGAGPSLAARGGAERPEPFGLLETLAVENGQPRHLEAHLKRLGGSALRFGIDCDLEAARRLLCKGAATAEAASSGTSGDSSPAGESAGTGTTVLRLHLALDGRLSLTPRILGPARLPVRLAVDTVAVDPDAPAVRHKTTDRAHLVAAIDRARARGMDVDDVVLLGRDGRVTETSIATILVEIDGRWATPPLEDGCLAGVGRGLALARGEITERPITVRELRAASRLDVLSSVRGRRPAMLVDPVDPVVLDPRT